MSNNDSSFAGFLTGYARAEEEEKAAHRAAGDPEVVTEIHRIQGMQNEKGDLLARIYLADEIVKLRRALKDEKSA